MSTESDLSQRVFEPSPNHQIPLKGLRPPGPGVLPFSCNCLAKFTSILISAPTDLAWAEGCFCPSQPGLGFAWFEVFIPERASNLS